jgi:hypothetical protein
MGAPLRAALLLQDILTEALTVRNGETIIARVSSGLCGLLVALCLAARVAAAAPAPAAPARQEALAARLHHIESAFRQDDAGALRGSFTNRGKLRLDLPQVPGCPASYGAGQLQAIFGQLFADAGTRAFAFAEGDGAAPDDTVFARATWARGGTGTSSQALTFTLREEEGDWRIHEILAPR